MASKILKRKPTHVGTSEGSKSFIKILLNHRCQCITHQHKHTLKQVTQTTVLSEVTQWKFFFHWQQHSDRFHFEYRSVPRLCDPHVFVGQILRPCVMSKTINYSAGVQGRELGWSVPFLLDDAGLNKGPPTNTNTGSWLLSFTNFFVFLCQLKYVNTLHIRRLFGRVHWWKTTGMRRFTLQLQRGPVEIWFSSVTKCWPRSSKNTK